MKTSEMTEHEMEREFWKRMDWSAAMSEDRARDGRAAVAKFKAGHTCVVVDGVARWTPKPGWTWPKQTSVKTAMRASERTS